VTAVRLLHLSDLHFGRDAQLDQIEALEELAPRIAPGAVVLSGDLTQRCRHGELQRARAFVRAMERTAPTLTIPGNHDVEWWKSPFGLFGREVRHRKYLRYFPELTPTLRIPGAVLASALTSHGVALGSMTWNLNDMAVKGHLPSAEAHRVAGILGTAPEGAARVLVVHHNVLRGAISERMGLARWRQAQRLFRATGAELILCGHDHQESCGELENVIVSTAGTHTHRCRGGRPSAFNLVTIDGESISVQHIRRGGGPTGFTAGDLQRFGRRAGGQTGRRADGQTGR
jgi:3',5'-cyclic AMP phosphodiesterase CpdA